MSKSVFSIAGSLLQAESLVRRLRSVGFVTTQISVLFRVQESRDNLRAPGQLSSGSGARRDPSAIDWPKGMQFFGFPGLGLLMATGPLKFYLCDSPSSGLSNALRLTGLGPQEADQFEQDIREGRVLVSLHSNDNLEIKVAQMIFGEAGIKPFTLDNVNPEPSFWRDLRARQMMGTVPAA